MRMKIIGNKKALHTPEFHKKKLRERYTRITIGVLIFLVIVGAPTFFLRQERFLISNIQIQGNEITKSEEIEKIIQDDISGNYLWLIPRSSVLLYPNNKIKADILRQIPRLISINLSLTDSRTLLVTIVERKPFALYCVGEGKCFFLDQTGYIFSEAPAFSGGVYMIYSTIPVLEAPLGQNLIYANDFVVLSSFIKSLPVLNLNPQSLLIQNGEDHLTLSSGGVIMWKSSANLESLRSNLESFLSDSNFTKEPNALEKILYIDLRLSNKIFYKFK